MSLWSAVEFETYEGWRKYIVREWSAANRSLLNEDRVGKDDFPEIGNYVAAEDWGDNERGPVTNSSPAVSR